MRTKHATASHCTDADSFRCTIPVVIMHLWICPVEGAERATLPSYLPQLSTPPALFIFESLRIELCGLRLKAPSATSEPPFFV